MGAEGGYSTGEGLIDCCEWPEVMSASEIIEVIDRFHFSAYTMYMVKNYCNWPQIKLALR